MASISDEENDSDISIDPNDLQLTSNNIRIQAWVTCGVVVFFFFPVLVSTWLRSWMLVVCLCRALLYLESFHRSLHSLQNALQSEMSLVTVICISNEDFITISFTYEEKQRNMKRPKSETLEKSLKRINLSIQNSKKKGKKGKAREEGSSNLSLSLWHQDERVKEDILNVEAWKDGSELRIGKRFLPVEVNPPGIVSLSLPSHIMAEFPIFPELELQFAEVNHCSFQWFRSKHANESPATTNPSTPMEWEIIGRDFFYKPTILDIGSYIKLECTAGRCNRKSNTKSKVTSCTTVSAGPGICPFEERHLYTSKKLRRGTFRLVCYNILANIYAKEDFALNVLYPYCPSYALDIGYRKQILLKELTGYNADILCLQECGMHMFDGFLQQSLTMLGYQGMLKCKAGGVPEGEAVFFLADKFELVSSHDIVLKKSLVEDPKNKEILEHVSSVPEFLENLLKRNSVAQITLLKDKCKSNQYLCVTNTHLYYKPDSTHIRLVQTAVILNQIKKVVNNFLLLPSELQKGEDVCDQEAVKHPGNDMKVAVFFCGDFNSLPTSATVQLLMDGHVGADHQDWTRTEQKDQHCTTLNLSHDFNFLSSCGILPFTVYTDGFKDTVDYIFFDAQQFEVEAVVPMPLEEALSTHIALPSVVMPSDHLALVCDLGWKA